MTKSEITSFLSTRRGYLKYSYSKLAGMFNSDVNTVKEVINHLLHGTETSKPAIITSTASEVQNTSQFKEFLEWKKEQGTKELKDIKKLTAPEPYLHGNPDNVLVIGDLHEPFTLDSYLTFCREQQEKFNCGTVVFIGDLIDGHSWSYHEADPDGMGQNIEITKAKARLARWFHTFPIAKCTLGNHDLLVTRKARTHGLSAAFFKNFNEIWEAPIGWEFSYDFTINTVRYVHGDAGDAIKVAKDSRVSTVQGHLHTQAFVMWSVSEKDRIYGFQIGCGIDHKKYAFEYAKSLAKKPVIGCGVVLEKGQLPISLLMPL